MMQVGTNQSTTYHSQPSISTSGGQTGRSSSTSRQQQSQYDNEQLANIRPRLCILRKWPYYDGYGVHLARNQHWLGLRIGDVEPNSPAESGGLLREDVVLAVNGHSVENDDFFVILSFIQHELEDDQIRFLVLDPHNADLARRNHINIDENYRTCVRMETPPSTVSPEKLLYDQWRSANHIDPTAAQNIVHLGPTSSINQNQTNTNTQRYQQLPPQDGRDDVYTFLPYSDHAIENGRSFFDVLFDQDNYPYSNQQQPQHTLQYSSTKDSTDDNDNVDNKDKSRISLITGVVNNLVKSGFENLKSVLPTKQSENKDKYDDTGSKRKKSSESIDNSSNTAESPSLVDQFNNKIKRSSIPSNTIEQETQSQPYGRLWQASSQQEDTNANLRPEPRLCSLALRPGKDTIGITLQPDKDFGHIIKYVEPNSPADRAGIERDDCILSLNDIPMLNIPYEDVLNILKTNRNEPNLDFLVAKKSYLLKSHKTNGTLGNIQNDTSGKYIDPTLNTSAEVMPSSNISERNNTSTVPPTEALEELYKKYNTPQKSSFDEQKNKSNRPRETVSTTTTTIINEKNDQRSPPLDDDRYSSKQQGQILQGVGPATADRSSWGVSSGKSTDDLPAPISGNSSIRSTSRSQQPETDDTKGRSSSLEDSFKPLQVGITNPTPASEQRDSSPKVLPSPDTVITSTPVDTTSLPSSKENQSIQNLQKVIPIAPVPIPSTIHNEEQEPSQTTPSTQSDIRLGTAKAMSAPSKPIKSKTPMNVYDDTDDDDLSDISEESREEDSSDPVINKKSQTIIVGSVDDKKDKPYSESSGASKSVPFIPVSTSDYTDKKMYPDKNQTEKRELTSTNLGADEEAIIAATVGRSIVQARRLEQSDSEDTTSATDSQPAKQSTADSFYSPDESIDDKNDIDEQRPTKSVNQRQTQNDTDEDEDNSSNETSSNESQKTPIPIGKMALATMQLSELPNYGYELHNIQLMQPTETSPVGLKLTKQQDPLQYIITAVAKGTKADLAGLKVNDWLIKIEDNDIRLVEFAEVSQDIRQLLTNAGLINMVIARKKTSTSSPLTKQVEKQKTPSSSRSDSLSRQQGGQIPTSLLTTDITRDTPDNSQVRFIPDQSTSPPTTRSQRSPISNRETNVDAPGGPLSVGLTNPIPDENLTKSPRSQSRSPNRSPTREYTINQQQKPFTTDQTPDDIDQNEIRHVVLKEALGLDFNSFIPEGDSQVQTHFISNVQPSSMADKAGLRDGDRILTVNGVDVTNSIHEDVRRMMQSKKPLKLSVVNDPKYLELIENVKRNQNKIEGTLDKTDSLPPDYETVEQEKSGDLRDTTSRTRPPMKTAGSDSSSELNVPYPKFESPKAIHEDLSKYLSILFTDNEGPVQIKHCLLKKDPNYNGYGLLLRYQNGLHLIDQVEESSPAYNAGLREDDVILYVDKKNVEQMTHDDVKILIRKLSLSNTNIDLILIKKHDIQRYKIYQERNSIDWKPIFQDKLSNEIVQTEQQEPSVIRSSNDQTSNPRKSSSSSGKQQAPAPPTSSTIQSILPSGTRVCILQPSADRTAGFALSGKSPPPYIICQIEKNSPAEKAGLLLNDALLSINGKSVTDKSYEDTVKLVKEALQQKSVELVVQDRTKMGTQSSSIDPTKLSMDSNDSNNVGNNSSIGVEPSRQGTNAVEEYQKQRNKELSYTLRLCHLHPTNIDGTQAATFGFELSEDPDYEYPLILRVEPQSPAEGAGLQSRDILLKINERKTKGLGYNKVKKEIEKAKRDGHLEMLVVDQETFDYCQRTKKPLKEPEMKVKHIFPKGRSSASVHKLSVTGIAAAATSSSMSSKDSIEQFNNSITKPDYNIPSYQRSSVPYRLSTSKENDSENEEDNRRSLSEKKSSPIVSTRQSQPPVNFDLNTPTATPTSASAHSKESPLKFFDRAQISSQQVGASSTGRQNVPNTAQSTPVLNQTSTKESKGSKKKALPNALNSLLQKIGHPKSSKPDYEAPPKTTISSKTRAPSPPTVRVGHNRLDVPNVSQSLDTVASNTTSAPVSSIHDTVRSTISTGSFDYLRGPRRCVLKVDRNKGLGFVLSATGDYDHTITAVEKYSAADIAGLQVNDEVLEVDGVDVRSVKYEQVVEMLVSAMRINESIEMRVSDGRSRDVYPSKIDVDKQTDPNSLLNTNNNNNTTITTTTIYSQRTTAISGDDLSDINSSISPFDSFNQQKIATSYPNLPGQLRQFDTVTNRGLSGSVPVLATGITAASSAFHQTKSISTSSEKGSVTRLSDISTQDAPVARLCRIRKFATSPFYGFFLCGDPKKLGRVFISDVTKHSPAAVCGLRDGDRIIEINGITIDTLTYETILDKIKQHMGHDDLELLVLDKKAVHWYRERNYPITSRTLPTIVHIEPIINDGSSETQLSEIPATHTKLVGFADRRVSKTGL